MYCGAGCINDQIKSQVQKGLNKVYPKCNVEVYDDLEFIGHILNIDNNSLIAILGTGANVGLWRNGQIIKNVPSGGYLLGDEGSGYSLGKSLIINYIRGNFLSNELKNNVDVFLKGKTNIVQKVYQSAQPNQYIASFAPLLLTSDDPLCQKIILNELSTFIEKRILPIKGEARDLHLFGSIGFHFQKYLKPLLREINLNLGIIAKNPIEALITKRDEENIE
jgi:N-acetylglucosamine kinase-like BadF-type ATPase